MSAVPDGRGPLFVSWRSWDDARGALERVEPPDTVERLQDAFEFAVARHADQVRPAGEPYAEHLLEVLEILVSGAGIRDERTLLAAALHDVVEDTDCSLDEVRSRFGADVAELVDWLTKPDAAPEQAGAARQSYLDRLERAPEQAVDVKLADRLSNVQRLDTHPRPEKQRSYYRETVETIVPLARRRPWFEQRFSSWRDAYRHLESPERAES